ncbi:rhomboid mitochondrial [Micractinium conductrix]|uniref:Rhomboid mitochondrial n=1 Tax=Micractinium conductrix TaxID=554055 RepID=A0A2P6V656_9CHLO|nr:rhomboid mitochondrial [Micractinium conductrix]|eukprot:PSC69569.1 rhomboid mitochondrial [Micractinium conductrix]
MSEDSLVGALTGLAAETARLVRHCAEEAVREMSGALGADELRWPRGLLDRTGPVIPKPYKQPGQGASWHDAYMASCAVSVVRSVQQQGLQPVTAAAVLAQAALHFRPGGYRLLQVGLNAHRVVDRKEWRRLGTGVLLHGDLPHLVSNCTALVQEGAPLERRLGGARFAALLASTTLLSQGLYVLSTKLAASWLPNSSLATDYFRAYGVGFSGVCMALKVIAGYLREADILAAPRAPPLPEEFVLTGGRLAVWPTLLMSHLLVPAASLPGHVCGIAAGLLHVYAARALRALRARLARRRGGAPGGARRYLQDGRLHVRNTGLLDLGGVADHPGLGWWDLGSHAALAVASLLAAAMAEKRRSGRP